MTKILKGLFLWTLLFHSLAHAYIDTDFDGVEDHMDQCKNTPFSDLVDEHGCTVKKVPITKAVGRITFIMGANYAYYRSNTGNKTKTLSESLEIDYDINRIKMQLYISRFNTKNSPYSQYNAADFADTRLSLGYTLDPILPNLQLTLGGGIALPIYQGTMHNNRTDFFGSLTANYFIGKTSLFAGYTYTYIGDRDLSNLKYQNTKAINLGIGYSFTPNLYSSLAWFWSDSIISSAPDIKNISIFTYINIDPKLFGTFTLSHDLDDDAVSNSYGLQIGYRL